jgi:sugar phosphate permease
MNKIDLERLVNDKNYRNQKRRNNELIYFLVCTIAIVACAVASITGQLVIDQYVVLCALGVLLLMSVIVTGVVKLSLNPLEVIKNAIGFFELYYLGFKVALSIVTKPKH